MLEIKISNEEIDLVMSSILFSAIDVPRELEDRTYNILAQHTNEIEDG